MLGKIVMSKLRDSTEENEQCDPLHQVFSIFLCIHFRSEDWSKKTWCPSSSSRVSDSAGTDEESETVRTRPFECAGSIAGDGDQRKNLSALHNYKSWRVKWAVNRRITPESWWGWALTGAGLVCQFEAGEVLAGRQPGKTPHFFFFFLLAFFPFPLLSLSFFRLLSF